MLINCAVHNMIHKFIIPRNTWLAKVEKSLFNNAFFAGLTSLSDILFLVLLIISGRYLGAEDFGVFSTSLAISTLLMYGTNLGLDSLAIRKIAIDKSISNLMFGDLVIWKALVSTAFISILFGAIYILSDNIKIQSIVYILCIAALFRSFNISCRSILQARGRFDIESYIVIYERIFIFLIGIYVLSHGMGLVALAYTFLVVRFSALLIYFFLLYKLFGHALYRPIGRHSITFQKEALPFGLSIMVYGLFSQVDILLLSYFKSDAETGIFSAAYKLYEGFLIISLVLSSIVYPRLSNYSENNIEKFYYYTNQITKILILSGFIIITAIMLYSDYIIRLFFGTGFSSSADLLRILSISILLAYFGSFLFTIFRSIGQQANILKIMLLSLFTKSMANFIFIPAYSEHGAAFGVLAGTLTISIAAYFMLENTGHLRDEVASTFVRSLMLFPAIYCVCSLFQDHLYVSITLFVILSVTLSLLFRIARIEELRTLFFAK